LAASTLDGEFASPESYTPDQLADKIRAARSAIEGERKLITVLFADVAGFTAISSKLDPEDTHAIMQRCFGLMLDQVHRYEGTVSQFLGDGMLALFGAPIAHEDHAQRAIYAGLEIQEALTSYQKELSARGIDFRVRIGLNSGPVVVGNVGADLTMNYQAVGDTVNLASRMQTLAPPGSVVISDQTYHLVEGYFECRAMGPQLVKGKEDPIPVYEVLARGPSRSRVDVHAQLGLGPYVGRRAELDALAARWDLARRGEGQVAFVSGEAGLGKSRLVHEFRHRSEDHDFTWITGRCSSYGVEVSYLPIVDMLRDGFRLETTDSDAEIATKLEAGLQRNGVDPSHLPYLRHLLSVEPDTSPVFADDPQLRKAKIFEALRDVVIGAANTRPVVLVIEDLHWMDPVSTEVLSYVIEHLKDHPILLIATHRSEWVPRFGERSFFTRIDLVSLTETETASVAGAALGVDELPSELTDLVFQKAEGNPFFVEEVAKSLLEAGAIRRSGPHLVLGRPIEEIFVPDTVQDVIQARLDRLPDDARRALQTASVIGREFTARLVDRAAALGGRDDPLTELKDVELIYERSLYPELAYMFKHALTHDVAYASLLLERRKLLHGVVADAIVELYGDRLTEHDESLAHHYERAERWSEALAYLVRSGEKALAAFAPAQAVSFLERALMITDELPSVDRSTVIQIHHGLGQAMYLLSRWDESSSYYDAMREDAISLGDRASEGVALFQSAISLMWAHRFEDAMGTAERARSIGDELESDAIIAGSLITIEGVHSVTGNRAAAAAVVDEASRVASRSQVPALEGITDVWAGFHHHWAGDERGALEIWQRGATIGRTHQIPIVLLWTLWTQQLALIGLGRYTPAIAGLEEHLELTKRLGDKVFRCRALNTLGWAYIDLCHWDRAIEFNSIGRRESKETGDPEIIRNAELNLADCHLATGDIDAARGLLETVERDSRASGTWGEEWMKWRYSQHLHASLGELWLARGDPDQAIEHGQTCVTAAERTHSTRNIAKGRRILARSLATLGKLDAALTEADLALEAARSVGNPAQVWKTLSVRGDILSAQQRMDDAAQAYRDAGASIDEVARGLSDAGISAIFRAAPEVRSVLDKAVASRRERRGGTATS
jgi:class 3 adenylate cyclase/tetratricopeptide (TPR) repeat protein